MKLPMEWSTRKTLILGALAGVAVVAAKLSNKHNLLELGMSEIVLVVVLGGALGSFLAFSLKIIAQAGKLK